MRWLRGGVTAIGMCLAWAVVLACLIDHEGVHRRSCWNDSPRAFVVLGARVDPDGTASPVLAARVKHAVKLLEKHDVLLFSGGVGTFGASEASVARDLAVQLGVPSDRCLLEEESHSTLQNAAFSVEQLKNLKKYHHVVVVSDPYHLARARRLFEHFAGQCVDTSPVLDAPRHVDWLERLEWTAREVPALLKDFVLTR